MKDKTIHDVMNDIEPIVSHTYFQGHIDGYSKGLDDAWECARKIFNWTPYERALVFGDKNCMNDHSASEAIAKIKKYEETEKNCKNCVNDGLCFNVGGCNGWMPKQAGLCCDSQATRETENCKACRFDWDNYESCGISYDEKHAHCIACDHSSGFEAVKDDEIKVGDEVEICGTGSRSVVTSIKKFNNKNYYRCVNYYGELSTENDDLPPTKTGRHFPQIAEVLKQMQEGESE